MKSMRLSLFLLLAFLTGGVFASASSPEDVVKLLYPEVPGEGDPVIDLKSEVSPCLVCFASDVVDKDEEGLQNYFTDPIAAFLKRWALDEGLWVLDCVDFEPLVDGQDYIITGFVMKTESMNDKEAKVLVRFNNFETPVRLRFNLVKSEAKWLIEDIESPQYSLREMVGPCVD